MISRLINSFFLFWSPLAMPEESRLEADLLAKRRDIEQRLEWRRQTRLHQATRKARAEMAKNAGAKIG